MKLERLLESDGWDILLEDLEETLNSAITGLQNAQSWDNYNYLRGIRDGLTYATTLEKRMEDEFSQYAEELQTAQQAVDESAGDFE